MLFIDILLAWTRNSSLDMHPSDEMTHFLKTFPSISSPKRYVPLLTKSAIFFLIFVYARGWGIDIPVPQKEMKE